MNRTRIVGALGFVAVLTATAQASTLTLNDGSIVSTALVGAPGDTVGWDFTWTSTPVLDGTKLITPWLLVTSADFVLDNGINPVGVFTPYITLSSNYTVVGPDTGNGEVNPWSQPFDTAPQTGIGSYSINSFQSFGDLATGNIVLTYDEYRVSPNDPSFDPIADTIATGLSVSARTSVLVGQPSDNGGTAPEPTPSGLMVAGAITLAASVWRRLRFRGNATVVALFACALAMPAFGAPPIVQVTEQQELTASDAATLGEFGTVVAVDGDIAAVAAPSANEVYVFAHAGGAWTQTAKLIPKDAQSGDLFGVSVAVSNGTIVVGAIGSAPTGVVYVFTQAAGEWVQQAELTASDVQVGGAFGVSVALSGNTLVTGAPGADNGAGAVYVFTRSGGVWTQQSKLAAPAGDEQFGGSVAVSGETIAVGSPGARDSTAGKVYVFTLSGSSWLRTELIRSDASDGDVFGLSVSISGGTVVAGAWSQISPSGAAYVFSQSGTSWTQQAKLTSPSPTASDQFGLRTAIDGNVIVIGAPGDTGDTGAAYVFLEAGGVWQQALKLVASDGVFADDLGSSVAVSGGAAFVGAQGKNIGNLQFAGAAYVFEAANVVVLSNPPGRSFQLTGPRCNMPGQFTTPYAGLWSTCSLEWMTPDTATLGTRYTFENWWDETRENPRAFSLDPAQQTVISADFLTEYQLTTGSAPAGTGQIIGGGFYPAGTSATVDVVSEPGTVFRTFGGDLSGSTTPQTLLMDGPKSVTAFFAQIPAAGSSAIISVKSGPANNRTWTITVTNNGPGVSYDARLDGVMLMQTFGASCAPAPLRLSPASFPVALGTLAVGGTAQSSVTFDFSGCPTNARFSVSIAEVSNGGSSLGFVQLVNQFQ